MEPATAASSIHWRDWAKASTVYRVQQAAKNARRRQLVEAGVFRQRLSIVDAKKGNTTHIDLTPGSRSTGLRIDIPSAVMYSAAMYTPIRVR
jgi:hypothetical protein